MGVGLLIGSRDDSAQGEWRRQATRHKDSGGHVGRIGGGGLFTGCDGDGARHCAYWLEISEGRGEDLQSVKRGEAGERG